MDTRGKPVDKLVFIKPLFEILDIVDKVVFCNSLFDIWPFNPGRELVDKGGKGVKPLEKYGLILLCGTLFICNLIS